MSEVDVNTDGTSASFLDDNGSEVAIVVSLHFGTLDMQIDSDEPGPAIGTFTRDHAAALIPLLQCFAETGRLVREATTTESEGQHE